MPGTVPRSQRAYNLRPDKDAENFGNEKGTTEYLFRVVRLLGVAALGSPWRRIGALWAQMSGSQGTLPKGCRPSLTEAQLPPFAFRDFATLGFTVLTPEP